MNIGFYKEEDLEKPLKASIHRTGKLGFTKDTADKMKLKAGKTADIGRNLDDETDKNLYLKLYDDKQGMFPVVSAGEYYYLNTKLLFDTLKISYHEGTVSYKVTVQEIKGDLIYILEQKQLKNKKESHTNESAA